MSLGSGNWFSGAADDLAQLERLHINRRIIEFALFSREAPQYMAADASNAAKIISNYQAAKNLSPGVLSTIVCEPQFHFWTVHALHLLRRLKNGEAIPATDTPYFKNVL